MKTMGFPGYFLIVSDYIRAAREELGVSVGPGRGSAAGSVVAYCLKITDLDPLKYDLLFERFLNPDRISLPDIDVDFDDDGRGRVLDWITKKYGKEKVAHIITYGTMAAKSAIQDVGRVQKVP
ncbi:MAG: DNA polymerase III subunit alpha, partial [Thermoguttaceae bacterium]|nr:DNA polymerase III subunit alpha [Thermoguttaceae bacterium]